MQKIGDSTPTANGASEFTHGQPGSGVDATQIMPAWLNAIQRELVNVVTGGGLTLNPADDGQVLKAIQAIQSNASTWAKLGGKPTTVAGFGLADAFTKSETSAAIQQAVAALVASSPAALDTLKELADALGNDPHFATTVTNSLANKADKATTLVGYGIGDAFTKTETTLAIKAALAIAITPVSASKTLSAEELGLVLIDANNSALAIQLPPATAVLGTRDVLVRRVDNSGNRLVVQASGTDKIKFHTHLSAAGYPFLVLMGAGDWWHLRCDGAGSWWPVGRADSTPLGRPVFDTTTAFPPGGYGALSGAVLSRAEWPWLWDHARLSGMLVSEAARVGLEGGWTSGDGALTFRGPEGRGEFLRVCDESRGVDNVNFSGNITAGSPVVTGIRFQGIVFSVGMALAGVGIPAGATIIDYNAAGNAITMSSNATATTAVLTIVATGRVPGSRQNGSLVAGDMDGTGGFSPVSAVAPEQPRVNRGDPGWDTPIPIDYPAGVSATVGGAQALNVVLSTTPSWFGVSRPRNIAYADLSPGKYVIVATRNGQEQRSTVELKGGAVRDLNLHWSDAT